MSYIYIHYEVLLNKSNTLTDEEILENLEFEILRPRGVFVSEVTGSEPESSDGLSGTDY